MENSSRFFSNPDCSYFPCHKGSSNDRESFNCLFCYCPLYSRIPCPGNPTYIKKDDGRIVKRCTDCNFPHKPENYDRIMSLLKGKSLTDEVFQEYHHGGEFVSSLMHEKPAEEVCYDFSVNTNPLGLPDGVKNAVQNSIEQLERYPDQNCTALRKKIAEKIENDNLFVHNEQISPENIIIGNGASELISLIVQAVSPKNALVVAPTFSGYERALKICYSKIHYHLLKEENDFTLDSTIFSSIENAAADMVFLCSPNNPTGKMPDFELLKKLVSFCEERCIFLFVDECFIGFTEKENLSDVQFVSENPHLIVLNAFTKVYSMAGIRLGYAFSSNQGLLAKVNFLRPEWNVSSLAQLSGLAALNENAYLHETCSLISRERDYLNKKLKTLGFTVYPSEANFILFKADSKDFTESFNKKLIEQGILLRNCGNFVGLTGDFFRTAIKNHEENEKLIEALADSLGKSFSLL